MPVVNVNLLVDEKTYDAVQAGVLELCGMAKILTTNELQSIFPLLQMLLKKVQLRLLILFVFIKRVLLLLVEFS